MRVIIAGSRTINSRVIVCQAMVQSGFNITEVVSGLAKGVDSIGKELAEDSNIPVKEFPADWNRYGKGAGYKRNVEMAKYADALIAVWDGKSKGTQHMIDIARKEGLQVFVLNKKGDNPRATPTG